MLLPNFVLHTNHSNITLLVPFDPMLFLSFTASHCEESLLSDYRLTDRHKHHVNVQTHTLTHTIFHTTNVPQSTYCLVAAVSKWDY